MLEFHPLTPDRWGDFERLFGPRGACAGCWCMYWKLPRRDFDTGKYEGNRLAQKAIVYAGGLPGLLAYVDGSPAGWCAVEPREHYPGLARSRILAPIDTAPVWSVTCFYIDKTFRRQGLSTRLLRAVVDHVSSQGGRFVEGYPTEPRPGTKIVPAFVYTGLAHAFREAGFKEVGRRSETRPIMRFHIR
jgi:GNAT superfamily N-acetyltransferase